MMCWPWLYGAANVDEKRGSRPALSYWWFPRNVNLAHPGEVTARTFYLTPLPKAPPFFPFQLRPCKQAGKGYTAQKYISPIFLRIKHKPRSERLGSFFFRLPMRLVTWPTALQRFVAGPRRPVSNCGIRHHERPGWTASSFGGRCWLFLAGVFERLPDAFALGSPVFCPAARRRGRGLML